MFIYSYNGLSNTTGKEPRQRELCNKFWYYTENYQHLFFHPLTLIIYLLVPGKVDTPPSTPTHYVYA